MSIVTPADIFGPSNTVRPKERVLVEAPMKNIIGKWRERAYWLSNERPLGHSEKSNITIRGLGHWVWDRSTDICYRTCRTGYRFEQLKIKLDGNEIKFKTKTFYA